VRTIVRRFLSGLCIKGVHKHGPEHYVIVPCVALTS
jgi:hypothetical protein